MTDTEPQDGTPLTVDVTAQYGHDDDYFKCSRDDCDARFHAPGGLPEDADRPVCTLHDKPAPIVPMKRKAFLAADESVQRAEESQQAYLAELEESLGDVGDGTGPAIPASALMTPTDTRSDDDASR